MSSDETPVVQDVAASPGGRTLMVRYGRMRLLGQFPYEGEAAPGCGGKVVIRTRRGTELAEVLVVSCGEGGCAKGISAEQIEAYINESGGKDFPFSREGRVLRVATADDVQQQKRLDAEKPRYLEACRQLIRELELPMKLVDVDLILGGEMATFYFLSENRVDFRSLVRRLASQFHTRIQMHQIGARDEARLVADYETCGQHCCCRQFLKVLRPVSMGAAKMQKATLDPSKISGRCGRLKCCLRYEESTYEQLRRRLPRTGARVRTAEGEGTVEETMILTQLVKVRLDEGERVIAVSVEELLDREGAQPAGARPAEARRERPRPPARERREDRRPPAEQAAAEASAAAKSEPATEAPAAAQQGQPASASRRRRRRGRGRGGQSPPAAG